jgi:hypothetical protein
MPEPPASPPDELWSDLRPVIDEELARLPERLRLPVVLCDLEGRPQRQVAGHLGLALQTLSSRLASARRLLAARLTRRGIALSGGALAAVLGGNASAAVVPPALADGLARAAEAAAVGSGVGPLVSARAIQLSEGVIRMMLVAKLRTAGAAALTALALTTGVGFGLVPVHAGDPKPEDAPKPGAAGATKPPAGPVDDETFFRRACLDLRGTPPNEVEAGYFGADRDASKRRKVVDWLLTDEAVKAYLAKKLGIPAERIHVITFLDVGPVDQGVVMADIDRPAAAWAALDRDTVLGSVPSFEVAQPAPFAGQGKLVINEAYTEVPVRWFAGGVSSARGFVFGNATAQSPQPYNLYRRVRLDPPPAQSYPLVVDPTSSALGWLAVGVADEKNPPADKAQWLSQDLLSSTAAADTDAAFLRRAVQSARGAAPSAVEERYFAEDKDPKKREKLLDLLLKDPAVAKRLGDDWKKKMLEPKSSITWIEVPQGIVYPDNIITITPRYEIFGDGTVRLWDPNQKPTRLEKLVGELVGAKKTDEQVLDGLILVVLGRLPTESEKKLTLATIGKAADKTAAWVEVAKALSATEEARAHAAELNKANPAPKKPPEKK